MAFYEYEWYNISPVDLKMVLICMIRASKPLQLTSGKFFVLSLYTFTDVRISLIAFIRTTHVFPTDLTTFLL